MLHRRLTRAVKPALLIALLLAMLACFNFGDPFIPKGPLSGVWKETAQVSCDTGQEVPPPQAIRELNFKNDRQFSVTWHPFETYEDYWGTYTYDAKTGTLTLKITDGNYEPPDVDLDGTAAIDSLGRLVLTGIWLGTPAGLTTPTPAGTPDPAAGPAPSGKICAQIFEK